MHNIIVKFKKFYNCKSDKIFKEIFGNSKNKKLLSNKKKEIRYIREN